MHVTSFSWWCNVRLWQAPGLTNCPWPRISTNWMWYDYHWTLYDGCSKLDEWNSQDHNFDSFLLVWVAARVIIFIVGPLALSLSTPMRQLQLSWLLPIWNSLGHCRANSWAHSACARVCHQLLTSTSVWCEASQRKKGMWWFCILMFTF